MRHTLPELPYQYDSFEPYIDEETMIIHHLKHHNGYIEKLNMAIENYPELKEKTTEELLSNLDAVPEEIRTAVRNNGGGHLNHSFFWELLKKDTTPSGKILAEINLTFESFDNFKEKFLKSAISVFGSGWTWLVLNDGTLEITNTSGHDNPIMEGKTPLMVIDMWEHAYYLKFQNEKSEYVTSFFNVINWEKVNENFMEAK